MLRATLIIAKLDRLARSVHFVSGLMEAGVDFAAVDFPQANRLTVHILAAVAEHEANPSNDLPKLAGPPRSFDCAVAGTGAEGYGVEWFKALRHAVIRMWSRPSR